MTRPLTKLEWLGVESAFRHAFGGKPIQWKLAVLLIRNAGRTVGYSEIADFCGIRPTGRPGHAWWQPVNKANQRLRELLKDWGLGDILVTLPSEGLTISRANSDRLMAMLDESLGGGLFE